MCGCALRLVQRDGAAMCALIKRVRATRYAAERIRAAVDAVAATEAAQRRDRKKKWTLPSDTDTFTHVDAWRILHRAMVPAETESAAALDALRAKYASGACATPVPVCSAQACAAQWLYTRAALRYQEVLRDINAVMVPLHSHLLTVANADDVVVPEAWVTPLLDGTADGAVSARGETKGAATHQVDTTAVVVEKLRLWRLAYVAIAAVCAQ